VSETTEFPVLETSRLRLDRLGVGEAPEVFQFFTSDDFLRFIGRERLSEPEQAIEKTRAMSAAFDEGTAIWWAFRLHETNEFVGYGGLFEIDRENRKAEVGYGLRPEHWGRGLATEAVRPIVEHGLGRLGLHRIFGMVDPRNAASIQVLEKLGFQLEGTLRANGFARGRFWDHSVLAIVAE